MNIKWAMDAVRILISPDIGSDRITAVVHSAWLFLLRAR